MGSFCAVALIVLGPRTDYMAIPLGPLSSTAPELSLGIYTIGAPHVLLAPTVLQPSPCGHVISHAPECRGSCQGFRQGSSYVLCPRHNVVSQVWKPSNTSSPIWSLEFFSNSLDENIKIACFYWLVSESREFLLRFPGYRALEQRIKPGLHRR